MTRRVTEHAEEIEEDKNKFYKEYSTTVEEDRGQIDILSDIDILKLTDRNDILNVSTNQTSLIVDFADGHDGSPSAEAAALERVHSDYYAV